MVTGIRVIGVGCVLLFTLACGRSPIAPSETPSTVTPPPAPTMANLAGTWSGRMVFNFKGEPGRWLATRVELQQTDRVVTGIWVVTDPPENDIKGAITGALEGNGAETIFRGTVDLDSPSTGGNRCLSRGSFEGPSLSTGVQWKADSFQKDNCTDPGMSNIVWTLVKQ